MVLRRISRLPLGAYVPRGRRLVWGDGLPAKIYNILQNMTRISLTLRSKSDIIKAVMLC